MMPLHSLRLRLLLFAAGTMAAALIAAWFGLNALFSRHLERRVAQELDTHLVQIAGGLRYDDNGAATLAREPADPRFSRIYGGLYWQAVDMTTGDALRSRSLFDAELPLPVDELTPGVVHSHAATGPSGETLLVHEQLIRVPVGAMEHRLRLSVAVDRRELDALEAGFARDLAPALALLGVVLLAGFAVQIGAGLRPVAGIRAGIASIRAGRETRLALDAPSEIAPLVDEVNALLDAQDKAMARARDRAADLAHGLKTPLTALAADVERLKARGEGEIARDIDELAGRMRRHMDRELARARVRHGRFGSASLIAPATSAILNTLARTPDGERVSVAASVPPGLAAAIDADDLNEVIGNLAENAFRYARGQVRVAAETVGNSVIVVIEDDGAGLAEADSTRLKERGLRLDEKGAGAGLGLAIVTDILEAVGGGLELGPSALGGLRAVVTLPSA